jgi:hypothetical protein
VDEVVTSLTVFIVIATWVTITRIDDAGLLSHPSAFLCVTKYVLVPADEVEGIVAVALELGLGNIGLVVPYHLSSFPADAVAVRDVATSLRQELTGVDDTVGWLGELLTVKLTGDD